ncbi:MAG: hypothetical protein JWN34_1000 [Bryobacterales bacterium]|nr:hypothetical protein [Bryobacterales bacterium]
MLEQPQKKCWWEGATRGLTGLWSIWINDAKPDHFPERLAFNARPCTPEGEKKTPAPCSVPAVAVAGQMSLVPLSHARKPRR